MSTGWRSYRVAFPLMLLGIACVCRLDGQKERPLAPPAARFDLFKSAPAKILAFMESLPFDTVSGAADATQFLVGPTLLPGPHVKIEPEEGSYRIDDRALADGRVVARITSDSAYEKLGLGKGLNYWWVGKQEGQWRSRIYSSSLEQWSNPVTTHIVTHPNYVWYQSIARFVTTDTGVFCWVNCAVHGCCLANCDRNRNP